MPTCDNCNKENQLCDWDIDEDNNLGQLLCPECRQELEEGVFLSNKKLESGPVIDLRTM